MPSATTSPSASDSAKKIKLASETLIGLGGSKTPNKVPEAAKAVTLTSTISSTKVKASSTGEMTWAKAIREAQEKEAQNPVIQEMLLKIWGKK